MKMQRVIRAIGVPELVPLIAAGQLRSEMTQLFIYGTYLEVWWRCLKLSKEFTQSGRTGIFTSKAAFNTYCMFGSLDNMSFGDWWLSKGQENFSRSMTTLQISAFVKHKQLGTLGMWVDTYQDVSTELSCREFGFWLEQINQLNKRKGLLFEAPLAWPIFKSRISYQVISQLLRLMEVHEEIIRNAPNTCLWQIGEQLKMNPKAMTKPGDYAAEISVKHKSMGQTLSNYLKKGRGLLANASKGVFPKFN